MTDSILESLGGISPSQTTSFTQESPSSGKAGQTSSVEDRALNLLGKGIASEQVASALGVSPARISQLLAEEVFAAKVSERRYENLQVHSARDGKYDALEDKLLAKLTTALPLMVKPRDIIDGLTKVNAAKRRGVATTPETTTTQNVVQLIMPTVIAERFAVNLDNQVIRAGKQELLTMPSGNLLKQVEEAEALRLEGASNGQHDASNL